MHHCDASRSVDRKVLQALEKIGIVEKLDDDEEGSGKGGRRITQAGQRDLDRIAMTAVEEDEEEDDEQIPSILAGTLEFEDSILSVEDRERCYLMLWQRCQDGEDNHQYYGDEVDCNGSQHGEVIARYHVKQMNGIKNQIHAMLKYQILLNALCCGYHMQEIIKSL